MATPKQRPRNAHKVRVLEPRRIADDLEEFAGMWVAVKDGHVVEAGRTPDAVVLKLRARQVRDATILRVPGEDEPELVGIG
jgi:Family of unknown function (DUF5678)